MLDFISFNILITPYVIGIVYVLGALAIPFISLSFFSKFKENLGNLKYRLYLLMILVIGEVLWRIFCEFFIVYFKIYLSLQ